MKVTRRSEDRGHADHGWLNSYHSFSFADYSDEDQVQFGPLRVLNEDRVAPGKGFGTHAHRDMEIISYVLEGELAHQDSTGTASTIRPGDVQRMSAGSGVRHSEYNASPDRPVHFLQIWLHPDVTGIPPSYEEKHFGPAEKRGRLRLIASAGGEQGSVRIHQDARVYGGLFDGAESATLDLEPGRLAYIHVARGSVHVNDVELNAGDALKLTGEPSVDIARGGKAEILVFDLPPG